MKVHFYYPTIPDDPPAHLSLHPETARDQKTLKDLVKAGVCCGCGYAPYEEERLLHVQVKLPEIGNEACGR